MNHKRYFLFQLKRDLPLLSFVLGILLVIGGIIGLEEARSFRVEYYGRNAFMWFIWVAYALAYFFPLVHKRKFFNKRSCDLYLSLPVAKKGLYFDDALLGFLEVLGEFTIFYACLILFSPLTKDQGWIDGAYAGYAYGYSLLAILVAYLTSLGITSSANNLLDAIILLSLWCLAQFLFGGVIMGTVPSDKAFLYKNHQFWIHQDYTFPGLFFERSLLARTYLRANYVDAGVFPVWLSFVHLFIGLLWFFYGYCLSNKWQAEESQGTSHHFYGYSLFCGVALACTVGINFGYFGTPNWTTLLVQAAIGSVIYWIIAFIGERKIRFSVMNISFYFGSMATGFLTALTLAAAFKAWLPNMPD